MKITVYILAVAQVLLLLILVLGSGGSDAAGDAMAGGFAALGGILLIMFLMPAVLLARAGKALPLALGLTLLPLILLFLVRDAL